MTYSEWNIDQSDFRDEQPDDMGDGAQPARVDLDDRLHDLAGYGMQTDDSGFGEEPRRSVTGIHWSASQGRAVEDQQQDGSCLDVQTSQNPYRPEQSMVSADYGEQATPTGYGDEPQFGGAESQWR